MMRKSPDDSVLLDQALVIIERIRARIGLLPADKLAVVHHRLDAVRMRNVQANAALDSLRDEVVRVARTRKLS